MEQRKINNYYLYELNYKRNTTRKHTQQQHRIGKDTCTQHMCFNLISDIVNQANTLNNLSLKGIGVAAKSIATH